MEDRAAEDVSVSAVQRGERQMPEELDRGIFDEAGPVFGKAHAPCRHLIRIVQEELQEMVSII